MGVLDLPAYSRTQSDIKFVGKGTQLLYVKDYGAIGDGVTDDTVALQAAVNASINGKYCYLTGAYLVTSPILIPSNASIFFAPGSSVVRGFSNPTSVSGITQPGTFVNAGQTTGGNSNITILGNGTMKSQTSSMLGKHFAFYNVTGLRIESVGITTYYGDWAGEFKNVTQLHIEGCTWLGGNALGEDGIHLYGVQEATVANCVVHSGDDALAITNEAVDCIANKNINVTNCHLASASAAGIKMTVAASATAGISNVNVSNCTIVQSPSQLGMWIHDAKGSSMNDVKISNITLDCSAGSNTGVQIGGLSSDGVNRFTLTNITVQNPGGQPFAIQGSTKIDLINPIVVGSRGTFSDIRIDTSTDVKIIGGRSVGAQVHGVMIGSAGSCTDVIISNMTIDGAVQYGFRIINAIGTRLHSNRVKNTAAPFQEVAGCTFTVVETNDFRGNTGEPGLGSGTGIVCHNNTGITTTTDVAAATSTNIQSFSASGTWTKPAGVNRVQVVMVGGGAGGSSGSLAAAGVASVGGGGGGGGARTVLDYNAADLPASLAVGIGSGGTGGAAQTTASTVGSSGTLGGTTTLGGGTWGRAIGGSAPSGATGGGSGGGSGGGLTTAGVASAGGGGVGPSALSATAAAGGSVGSPNASAGSIGYPATAAFGGVAGAGGASSAASTGGNGSAAVGYGGGGGGGGAAINGQTSGAGGAGGAGYCQITSW